MLTRPILFVATADPVVAQEFYEKKLGLRFVADEPFALVFEVNGLGLRVQKVERVEVVGYTVLGWEVDDIEGAMTELTSRGIVFEVFEGLGQDGLGVWTAPGGARIAWFRNPDGNLLSLTQYRE